MSPDQCRICLSSIVLAGSFIRQLDDVKGDTVVADYGPFGSVSCYFG